MEKNEAQQIAAAINLIRGDWPQKQILTILGDKHQHRPARDAMIALTWIAFDPDTITPARINADGPWWAAARLAGTSEPTYVPPTHGEIDCRLHGQRQPCGGCRADRLAVPAEPVQPPELERAAGESLIQYAHRIADMRNTTEAALAATTEGTEQ